MNNNCTALFKDCEIGARLTERILTYTWRIPNLKLVSGAVGQYIESAAIVAEKDVMTVRLYAGGYETHNYNLGVTVQFHGTLQNIDLFRIHRISQDGQAVELYHKNKITKKIIIRELLYTKNYVTLTLLFEMYFKDKDTHEFPMNGPTLDNRLGSIFNNETFSDVRIAVGEKLFYVYKGILVAQSPVFAAMFEHDMMENKENTVQITDIDCEVMQKMLLFIYSGKVNNIKVVAPNLLVAADKYQLQQLKKMCEKTLIDDLGIETVTSWLMLAEKYGAKSLKERALEFFKSHARDIVKTEDFKTNLHRLTDIIEEIILTMAP